MTTTTDNRIRNIQDNIHRLRKSRHVTQSEMAAVIGINRRTYAAYEKGSRSMPVAALVRIADYFQISLDELAEAPNP